MDGFFPVAVYAAMLGGTVGGQFLGMGLDAVAFGRHILWVPLVCSVLLEALVGERFGASRVGHTLTARERLRLSLHYSLGLAGFSVPLVAWLAASHATREQLESASVSSGTLATSVPALVLGLLVYTALRTGLMTLFARRSR